MPVVLYDHDAVGGKAEAHVVFDSLAVGQAQGKRAAELIEKMDKTPVKVARVKGNQGEYRHRPVREGPGRVPEAADRLRQGRGRLRAVHPELGPDPGAGLRRGLPHQDSGGDVDVFLGMNDGTTGGSVAALISQGYQPGEKLVTGGQDATVEALRYIAQGWQDNSVLKNLKVEATEAAEVVASILAGKGVPQELVNGKVNNQYMDVPAVFLPVENITIDNLSEVVSKGVWTWQEICQGIESTEVCKANM